MSTALRNALRSCVIGVALAMCPPAHAEEQGASVRAVPSALLSIDQNRATVVDRIVADWGQQLAATPAAISPSQLREVLMAMRSDYLLAASVAGSLDGLRNVISSSLVGAGPARPAMQKALGDAADDLTYTPITPCRVVDTRGSPGGALAAGQTRSWLGANPGGNFLGQGGASSDCGIPVKPAAILANLTVFNTAGGPAFLVAWPSNQARPAAAALNWTTAAAQVANAVILPLCTFCGQDFSTYATSQTDMAVDVMGYFAAPIATALQCAETIGPGATVPPNSDFLVIPPSCPTGYTSTSTKCSGPAFLPSAYLVESNSSGCVFRNLSAATSYSAFAISVCCRIPGR
jgi:hypothetical protein